LKTKKKLKVRRFTCVFKDRRYLCYAVTMADLRCYW